MESRRQWRRRLLQQPRSPVENFFRAPEVLDSLESIGIERPTSSSSTEALPTSPVLPRSAPVEDAADTQAGVVDHGLVKATGNSMAEDAANYYEQHGSKDQKTYDPTSIESGTEARSRPGDIGNYVGGIAVGFASARAPAPPDPIIEKYGDLQVNHSLSGTTTIREFARRFPGLRKDMAKYLRGEVAAGYLAETPSAPATSKLKLSEQERLAKEKDDAIDELAVLEHQKAVVGYGMDRTGVHMANSKRRKGFVDDENFEREVESEGEAPPEHDSDDN
ncbi:hypothetical protein B0A50_00504 [Salinomyces thailandicus]|uniref:Uncharacterized protein n=1 Tax=Salinomyces thailandicus TaxID=706561 RepID=A0A4U0UDT4_9PEZI|nr:hypothetical protein B0A50_00504 [Salinomyces thailandica]